MYEGLEAVLAGNAFANAFWVFIGIVAGACIQFLLGMLTQRGQRKNAIRVLRTEIEMNLSQLESLLERVNYLRERISANQISDQDLLISMHGFDYSAVNPLVASGYFHILLGHKHVKQYFDFMRFFNNNSAEIINSTLRTEHAGSKSLDYLEKLRSQCADLGFGLNQVLTAISRGRK